MFQARMVLSVLVLVALDNLFKSVIMSSFTVQSPSDELRFVLLSSDFPTDGSSLGEVQHFLALLNQTRATNPYYVDSLFVVHYLRQVTFPRADWQLTLWLGYQGYVWIRNGHDHEKPFFPASHNFYQHALAGALYGKWYGLVLCTILSTLGNGFALWIMVRIFKLVNSARVRRHLPRRLARRPIAPRLPRTLNVIQAGDEANFLVLQQAAPQAILLELQGLPELPVLPEHPHLPDIPDLPEQLEPIEEPIDWLQLAFGSFILIIVGSPLMPLLPSWYSNVFMADMLFSLTLARAHTRQERFDLVQALVLPPLGRIPYLWYCVSAGTGLHQLDSLDGILNNGFLYVAAFVGSLLMMAMDMLMN